MTANLSSARCVQLRIGRLYRETSSVLGALNIILDEVNLLVKLAEGEVPMKYCRDCANNDKPSCAECFNGLQMSRYKKAKGRHAYKLVTSKGQVGMMEKETFTMVGYDLPIEKSVKDAKTKKFLHRMRNEIYRTLRECGCVPVQQSLWVVRDESKLAEIKKYIVDWKTMYESRKVEVNIETWAMATDSVAGKFLAVSTLVFAVRQEYKLQEKGERLTPELKKYFEFLSEIQDEALREISRHPEWFPEVNDDGKQEVSYPGD